MLNPSTDCPLLIVFGQSNAHGMTPLKPGLEIREPLKNVHGLSREDNQAYGLKQVTWSGFTSNGMNLGATRDHNYCLGVEFARLWQKRIDQGCNLPDLYVIEISIAGQGVDEHDNYQGTEINMWYPDRPRVLIPGRDANISLYPLAIEILALAVQSIRKMKKNPVVIGLHWNQWEAEVLTGGEAVQNAPRNYSKIWRGFRNALGMDYPLFLYRPLSDFYGNPEGLQKITDVFETAARCSTMVKLLDLRKSAFWKDNASNHGIFVEDNVHYLPCVHQWFAQQQWDALVEYGFRKP